MALKYLYVPSGVQANKAYGVLPNSANADFSYFSRGSAGSRVDKNGFITDVEANVPRLDYTGGGCPSLLLEPEATNYIQYSEDFSQSDWNKNQAVITSTNNVSPDGTNNATLLTDDNSGGTSTGVGLNEYAFTLPSAGTYAFSVFAKKGTIKVVRLQNGGYDANDSSYFNLDTGVVVSKGINHETATIEEYANGFFKIAVTFETTTDLTGSWNLLMASDASGAITKDGTNTLYVYGAQAEKLSYASSYIPTNGSTVTRSEDSSGNASDLSGEINTQEGVIFLHTKLLADDVINRTVSINEDANNYASIQYIPTSNKIYGRYRLGGSFTVQVSHTFDRTIEHKVAFKFKENDFSLWVNGVEVDAESTGSVGTVGQFTDVSFSTGGVSLSNKFYGRIKEFRIYDEVLSDNELEELTTL